MKALFFLLLALPFLQESNLREFTHKEGNFRIRYPASYRSVKPPREEVQLALSKAASVLLFVASESNVSLEGILDAIHEDQRLQLESLVAEKQEQIRVGGERAILVRKTFKQAGIKGSMRIVVFTHQGIAYRIIGVVSGGNVAEFERDLQTCLDHFEYLEDRKEWIEKFEGRPVRTALMGGLASFELRRPRWVETTFESERDYAALDRASFKFISDGAWVEVCAREATGGVDAAVEDLRHRLGANLEKPKSGELMVKVAAGDVRGFEVSSQVVDRERLIRGAVIQRDGVRLEVWLECLASLREAVRSDWDSLIAGFKLQSRSKPDEPPAFPSRASLSESKSDAGLAAVLEGATKLSEIERGEVLGLSPNGTTALVSADGIVYRQNLPNGRRQKLDLDPIPTSRVTWSRDGNSIFFSQGDQIFMASLDPVEVKRIAVRAEWVELGASPDELLVCTRRAPTIQQGREGANRLQVFTTSGEPRKVLVEFPLSQVSLAAISPNGRQIALVCNRDSARTKRNGHAYVVAADGTGLKQLTKDPEEISSIAWAPDGLSIYVLRRVSVGEEGDIGMGGSADVFRVSVETGAAVNVTRSGKIESMWTVGEDLVIKISHWGLQPSQRGLFRVGAAKLEKATGARRIPPIVDRRLWGKEVSERVSKAVGDGKALRDLVPSREIFEKAAVEFAAGVNDKCGLALDFSRTSLDNLWEVSNNLDLSSGRHPFLRLGLGAYYGETLRRTAGAEWAIEPVPFGDWSPAAHVPGTPLVEPVLPFSTTYAVDVDSESIGYMSSQLLAQRDPGQKILLIYPAAAAESLVRKATGSDYYQAIQLADRGEVKAALELLMKEMLKFPRNRGLAVEAISLCEMGGFVQEAASLTERAVAGGIEVPEVLIRHADGLVAKDPKAALELYRRAAQGEWPPPDAYIKLGKAYDGLGRKDIAESCWRRAFERTYDQGKRAEIRVLMGLPASPPLDE